MTWRGCTGDGLAEPSTAGAGTADPGQELSLLSMVCFLEELVADEMPITQQARAMVGKDLQLLNARPVLESLLLCFRRLSGCT